MAQRDDFQRVLREGLSGRQRQRGQEKQLAGHVSINARFASAPT